MYDPHNWFGAKHVTVYYGKKMYMRRMRDEKGKFEFLFEEFLGT